MAWADAMNDAGPFDGNNDVQTNIRLSNLNVFGVENEKAGFLSVIIIVSIISVTALE